MTRMSRNFMHELNTHVVPIPDLLSTFSAYIRVLDITTNPACTISLRAPARASPYLLHRSCAGRGERLRQRDPAI